MIFINSVFPPFVNTLNTIKFWYAGGKNSDLLNIALFDPFAFKTIDIYIIFVQFEKMAYKPAYNKYKK